MRKIVGFLATDVNVQCETEIYFDCEGGVLAEGLKLGRYIKRRYFKTYTMPGGVAKSACALAFLGGRRRGGDRDLEGPDRTVSANSRLVYHWFEYRTTSGSPSTVQEFDRVMVAELIEYFGEMNVDTKLMGRIAREEDYSVETPEDFTEFNIKRAGIEYWLIKN